MTKARGALALAMALAIPLGAGPVEAQGGPGFGGRGAGPRMGRSLDVLLEKQEELGLTEDQVSRLGELKATMEADVLPLADEIKVLRDRIRDGETDREEGYRELQALHGELLIASAPLRGRVQEILTVEQHRNLQVEMAEGRPGLGRGMAFQGRGGRGVPRGQLRGSRGGFGPRQGNLGQGRAPAFGFRQGPPQGPWFPGPGGGVGFRRNGGGFPPTTPEGGDGNLSSAR